MSHRQIRTRPRPQGFTAALGLTLLLIAESATAFGSSFVWFTSQSAFNARLEADYAGALEGLGANPVSDPLSFSGITTGTGSFSYQATASGGLYSVFNGPRGLTPGELQTPLIFQQFSPGVRAFGGLFSLTDFDELRQSGSFNLMIYTGSGNAQTLLTSTSTTVTSSGPSFLGLIDFNPAVSFSRIELSTPAPALFPTAEQITVGAQSGNDLNPVLPPGASAITINVASGTHTQTAAGYPTLSGTLPVIKTGLGTLVLDQANTLTGPTTVTQGTLQLAIGNALSTSAVTVAAGATLSVSPQVAAVVPALVNNGLVDVGLGGLTVTNGQTAETIVAAIVAGRDGGSWSGTSGITSSAAATQSERAVGWLNNGDGSYTVAFGAAGDWNLNGVVDFDDVIQFVSANLYDTGLPATWADGDFDYNGVVDFDDVIASVSANLFDTGPYNTAPGGGASLTLGGGAGLVGGGIVAVPEPATWTLVAAGAACVAASRRRIPSR